MCAGGGGGGGGGSVGDPQPLRQVEGGREEGHTHLTTHPHLLQWMTKCGQCNNLQSNKS